MAKIILTKYDFMGTFTIQFILPDLLLYMLPGVDLKQVLTLWLRSNQSSCANPKCGYSPAHSGLLSTIGQKKLWSEYEKPYKRYLSPWSRCSSCISLDLPLKNPNRVLTRIRQYESGIAIRLRHAGVHS